VLEQQQNIIAQYAPNFFFGPSADFAKRGGVNVNVNQNFNQPTDDKFREAKAVRFAMKAAFDSVF
jgi:hypothetical protein